MQYDAAKSIFSFPYAMYSMTLKMQKIFCEIESNLKSLEN